MNLRKEIQENGEIVIRIITRVITIIILPLLVDPNDLQCIR